MRRLILASFLSLLGFCASAEVTYKSDIAPILKAKCTVCHGGLIPQGGFRANSLKNLHKGGKTGKAIVPGNAKASLLYRQFFLPLTDKQHMPPNGAPQLTEAEKNLIRDWINQGAK